MIIGTAAYLSPEQARGLKIDTRSDIFSFGIVIYEMLTGATPFSGASVADIIAAVLHSEPRPLSFSSKPFRPNSNGSSQNRSERNATSVIKPSRNF